MTWLSAHITLLLAAGLLFGLALWFSLALCRAGARADTLSEEWRARH